MRVSPLQQWCRAPNRQGLTNTDTAWGDAGGRDRSGMTTPLGSFGDGREPMTGARGGSDCDNNDEWSTVWCFTGARGIAIGFDRVSSCHPGRRHNPHTHVTIAKRSLKHCTTGTPQRQTAVLRWEAPHHCCGTWCQFPPQWCGSSPCRRATRCVSVLVPLVSSLFMGAPWDACGVIAG